MENGLFGETKNRDTKWARVLRHNYNFKGMEISPLKIKRVNYVLLYSKYKDPKMK